MKDWQLLARISDEALFAGAKRVRLRTAQLALLALVFASFLAAWIAARLGGRILDLVSQAQLIGEGRFDLPAPDSRKDELGVLSRTFSEMSHRIADTQGALANRIQDLEQARLHLIQAEKLSAIGQLSSGLAHEIHSPLQSVIAASSILRQLASREEIDPTELESIAHDIRESVTHATRITTGLQEYSRTASQSPLREMVYLEEALEYSRNMLRGRKDRHRIVSQGPTDGVILGDPTQITQVILNLLLNALDADPSEQRVEVEFFQDRFLSAELENSLDPGSASPFRDGKRLSLPVPNQKAVGLRIQDHGPGISPEDFPRIFDPFFTTKASGRGTGLGLSIAQGLVWSHGGILLVKTHQGSGTCVTIKFPAATNEQRSP